MSRVCCSEAREQLCTEHVPLFASLPYDTQKYLADRAHHVRYERGTLLFAEGDVADAVRVVHEGTVKLRRTDADGRETIVELLTPGRTAGEDLFLDAGVYPYDGVCMTDVNLCEIRSGDFLDFLRLFPDAAASLIAQLSRRLREVRELNRLLTENDAARRLAGFLSAQDRRLCGRTIALTIDDIAALVNLRRETVSRKLTELGAAGLIERTGPKEVRVLDRARLKKLFEDGWLRPKNGFASDEAIYR